MTEDDSGGKVTKLRVASHNLEVRGQEIQKELDAMPPEKRDQVLAVAGIAKELFDNRETIRYVVAAVAYESPDGTTTFRRLTTEIEAADFALALKLLDSLFYQTLVSGGNMIEE